MNPFIQKYDETITGTLSGWDREKRRRARDDKANQETQKLAAS